MSYEMQNKKPHESECCRQQKCPTRCPGGCLRGQCKNGRCPFRLRGEILYGRPDLEEEAEFRRQCLEKAKEEQRRKEKLEYLNEERRIFGMTSFQNEKSDAASHIGKGDIGTDHNTDKGCPIFNMKCIQSAEDTKIMRMPARPLCMLEVPPYSPPVDDYSELSRFLRISTMPGYSNSDTVSEYKDNHNMVVWNNCKDLDKQVFKMKRDWLSNWGEFNVKEQRWRKAWAEKFGADPK